jgi:hypothetical protein
VTTWVSFQATVPESVMPELARYVAEVTARVVAQNQPPEPAEDRVDRAWIKLGTSGRVLLRALAELTLAHDATWISWPALRNAMGLDSRQASGVLGGVRKAIRDDRLFERQAWKGSIRFRMDPDVARAVMDQEG